MRFIIESLSMQNKALFVALGSTLNGGRRNEAALCQTQSLGKDLFHI
jgi:hypothetical protein